MPVIKKTVSPWVTKRLNHFVKKGELGCECRSACLWSPRPFYYTMATLNKSNKGCCVTSAFGLEKATHLPQMLLGTCAASPQLPCKRSGYAGATMWRNHVKTDREMSKEPQLFWVFLVQAPDPTRATFWLQPEWELPSWAQANPRSLLYKDTEFGMV